MPNVGPTEIVLVLIVVLIVFGPKRLPELGRSLGRGIREFKGSLSGELDDDDAPKPDAPKPDPPKPELSPGDDTQARPEQKPEQKSETTTGV
jgi:sec-independent protein translocase protein TatA